MSLNDYIIPMIQNEIRFINDPNGAKRVYVSVRDFISEIPASLNGYIFNVKDFAIYFYKFI